MRFQILAATLAAVLAIPAAVHAQNERILIQGERDRDRDLRTREEGVQVTAVGRVESVRPDGGFTMSSGRLSFTVYMPAAGLTRRPSGRASVGDRVRVTGELTERDRIAAEDIEIVGRGAGRPSNVLSGTIRNINTNQQRLTLQTDRGLLRVEWDENTEWTRNRARESARGFRIGDVVRVSARQQPGGDYLARRVIFGGNAGWENGGVGEIVSLNARSQTAEIDFDGRVETVSLRNATIRRQNRNLEIDDLRLGYDVRIQGTRQGAGGAIQATSVDVVRQLDDDRPGGSQVRTEEGTIEEVFADGRGFRIRSTAGDDVRVLVERDTRIVRGATEVQFNTLRRGQRVRVRGSVTEREERNDLVRALRVELL